MIRDFGANDAWLILFGAQWTIFISAVAFVGGGVVGIVITALRLASWPLVRRLAAGYIEMFRGTPLLLQLFIVYYGLPIAGLIVGAWTAIVIAFTLHASAFLAEIWRGSIQAVPRGQSQAAEALALSTFDRLYYVVVPQAVRIALPATVGFAVTLIKGTSLSAIVGFTELSRAGVVIANATLQPLLVFGIVAGGYFLICWPLSLLSDVLERRQARAGER